jgi:hypothetical protein
MDILRRQINQRGETPFLHVLSDNMSAIRLYEHLGFALRRPFYLTRIGRGFGAGLEGTCRAGDNAGPTHLSPFAPNNMTENAGSGYDASNA